MITRQIRIATILGCLLFPVLAVIASFFGWLFEEPGVLTEPWLSSRFQSIQPVNGKAVLSPVAVDEDKKYLRLSFDSGENKGVWTKPSIVDAGFKFVFTDMAKWYNYEVVKIEEKGVVLRYEYSAGPSPDEKQEFVTLLWK